MDDQMDQDAPATNSLAPAARARAHAGPRPRSARGAARRRGTLAALTGFVLVPNAPRLPGSNKPDLRIGQPAFAHEEQRSPSVAQVRAEAIARQHSRGRHARSRPRCRDARRIRTRPCVSGVPGINAARCCVGRAG